MGQEGFGDFLRGFGNGAGKLESGWTGDLIGNIALRSLDFSICEKLRGFVAKTEASMMVRVGAGQAESVHRASESPG